MVEALAEDGTIGIGTSVGGEPACYIIEKHLNRFVEGQVRILSLSLSISNRISDTTIIAARIPAMWKSCGIKCFVPRSRTVARDWQSMRSAQLTLLSGIC